MNQNCIVVSQLASRRQTLGFPLHKLAERCGVTEKSLRDWEKGGGSPPIQVLEHWAAALGLQLALVPVEKKPRHSVKIDWSARRIAVDGVAVRLAPMEWRILERLAHSPGAPVSQRQLFEHLYGEYRPDGSRSAAVRVLIGRLRRKLPLAIEAQLGRGYLVAGIEPPPTDANGAPQAVLVKIVPEPSLAAPKLLRETPAARPTGLAIAQSVASAASAFPQQGLLATNELTVGLRGPRHPVSGASCRAEELGVIEQFLAEKGVTRCPDPQSLAQLSVPTLIWDKVKRKWVRPSMEACTGAPR